MILSPADDHCPADGIRIDVGLDDGTPGGTARDGVLDEAEIDQTSYVCGAEVPEAPVCSENWNATDASQLKTGDPWSAVENVVRIGQSFKATETGMLTGIDVAVGQQSCGTNPDAEIELSLYEGVYDGTQTPIATRSILMSSLPNCGNVSTLGQGAPGIGYFDLASDCISLQSGPTV